jgi:hypothetical protein
LHPRRDFIIQQFSKYYLEDDNPLSRFEEDFEDFKDAWKLFTDRYACTKIKPKNVPVFFKKLPMRMRLKMGITEHAREEEINRAVLKMGINVDDGFIYFNEMLYRIMRAQFVTAIGLKFNKVMTVGELVTQFRIAELTLNEKLTKKGNRSAMENFFFVQLSSQPMNLFLTRMFYRTSFRTWKAYMESYLRRLKWDKEQNKIRARHEELGKPYTPPVFPQIEKLMEEVEITREELVELSLSEEDEFDDGNKSRKSNNTVKMLSEWTKSNMQ